eukprot:3375551-Rhodomonas_salina.1
MPGLSLSKYMIRPGFDIRAVTASSMFPARSASMIGFAVMSGAAESAFLNSGPIGPGSLMLLSMLTAVP